MHAGHSFSLLSSRLGAVARTFTYTDSRAPRFSDHIWHCGCAAREQSGVCELIPCAKHAYLNPVAYEMASDVRLAGRMA
jgi:hypothetical protein